MVDNVLIYGLATMGVAFLGLVVRYCFKSKCINVKLCCGALEITRDINNESEIHTNDIEISRRNSD